MSIRIADIELAQFTTGDGTNAPTGVVTASAEGTDDGTATLDYDTLVTFMHTVKRVYRPNAKLMYNDSTLLAIKKLVDGDGNLLWKAGNIVAGDPPTIDGHPYVINHKMVDLNAGKSILYGDFSAYHIRRVRGAQMVRFGEKYMNQLQIGFLMYELADGNLPNTEAIKHYTSS